MTERDKLIALIHEQYNELQKRIEQILRLVNEPLYTRKYIADEIERLLKDLN